MKFIKLTATKKPTIKKEYLIQDNNGKHYLEMWNGSMFEHDNKQNYVVYYCEIIKATGKA